MKTNVRIVKSPRRFSEEFKRGVVDEFEKGSMSVMQLSRLYGISNTQIYKWIYKFSNFNQQGSRIVEMEKSSWAKMKEMEQRIRDLERAVGQKQIMIDYLEEMIDVAKTELQIDIKKNYDTPQSAGAKKRSKK
ncbi:MAG: transposase [Bacteroidota bacterium]